MNPVDAVPADPAPADAAPTDSVPAQEEITLERVLESAARLQRIVPDAVLVGGTAAAFYAHHRLSVDHDHVLADLQSRFDVVLDALERDPDFVLNRATPNVIVLGSLGGIETGVRQLRRQRPLEVAKVDLPNGGSVVVPTLEEIIRIKAYLITSRNQTRDFLDLAALSQVLGTRETASILLNIDDYYNDETRPVGLPVRDQVSRQLANPQPKDVRGFARLKQYKGLHRDWRRWETVVEGCQAVAAHMSEG